MKEIKEIRPVRLEIDLDNLTNNIGKIREYIGNDTLIMAIVKANAYGHGAVTCGKVFLENGADRLGVSILSEGITLRKGGISSPIILLNYTAPSQFKELLKYDLIQSIYKYEDAKLLSDCAQDLKTVAKIHIKVETGMNRIGFLPNEDSIEDIVSIMKLPNLEVEGIFTHFAMADELDKNHTKDQYSKFIWVLNRLEDLDVHIPIKHVANSATILDLPEYKLDMVRPGIILYGHWPSEYINKEVLDIKPAMTLKSCISNIKNLDEGEGIGYGQTYKAKRKSKIATLPIGYADGYSRMLSSKEPYICINNQKVAIAGSICMDQLMADVTDLDKIDMDDEAILFGYDNDNYPSVEEIANKLGTVNYEILCMIGMRVPRIYIKEGEYIGIEEYTLLNNMSY